jgi:hypothetical protein
VRELNVNVRVEINEPFPFDVVAIDYPRVRGGDARTAPLLILCRVRGGTFASCLNSHLCHHDKLDFHIWIAEFAQLGLQLKFNRSPRAWWIWLPLGAMGVVAWVLQHCFGLLPSDSVDVLVEVPFGLVFGLAALWLLAPVLRKSRRLVSSLLALFVFTCCSVAALLAGQGEDLGSGEAVGLVVSTGVGAAVMSVALTLAGLLCRRRYGAVRFCLWLAAALVVLWLGIFTAMLVCLNIFSHDDLPAWMPLAAGSCAVGICCAILLPFLLLAFGNGFFRERLLQLLHLDTSSQPRSISASPSFGSQIPGFHP